MIEGKPIVVTYRPGQKYVLIVLLLGAVVSLLFAGKFWGTSLSSQQLEEMKRLEGKTVDLQSQLDNKSAELSRVALSAEVDVAALEQSRQEIVGLQRQIYQRDEELELYRELLQDNNQPNGLSVSDLNLSALEDGRIRYRWVARQKNRQDENPQCVRQYVGDWSSG